MIRKRFRFKRLVLGLAAAAILAPAAQARVYLPPSDLGPTQATQTVMTPLQADGIRWNAMAKFYKDKASAGSTVAATRSAGSGAFSWSDAGIGASAVFAGILVLLTAVGLGRRHRTRGLASA